MKKTLLFTLLALQSTASFATTQVLNCKGIQVDQNGMNKSAMSAVIKIVHPDVDSLLVINGEDAASERASIQVAGLPEIQVDSINVTDMRKSISISGYIAKQYAISVDVPVPALGRTGVVTVKMLKWDGKPGGLFTTFTCDSILKNAL